MEDNETIDALVPLAPEDPQDGGLIEPGQFDAVRAMTRFIIGGMIQGTDNLIRDLERHEQEFLATLIVMPPEDESFYDMVRYTVVGFVMESQQKARNRLMNWTFKAIQFGFKTADRINNLTDNFLTRPFKRQAAKLIPFDQDDINRWMNIGRAEEAYSRAISQQVFDETVDIFLDNLAHNAEVKEMIQQQSVDLASDTIGGVRGATINADNALENFVAKLIGRRVDEDPPPPYLDKRGPGK